MICAWVFQKLENSRYIYDQQWFFPQLSSPSGKKVFKRIGVSWFSTHARGSFFDGTVEMFCSCTEQVLASIGWASDISLFRREREPEIRSLWKEITSIFPENHGRAEEEIRLSVKRKWVRKHFLREYKKCVYSRGALNWYIVFAVLFSEF